jgi:hypothetical protein
METLLLTPSSLNSSACSAEYVIDLLYPQQAEATHRSRDEEVLAWLGRAGGGNEKSSAHSGALSKPCGIYDARPEILIEQPFNFPFTMRMPCS